MIGYGWKVLDRVEVVWSIEAAMEVALEYFKVFACCVSCFVGERCGVCRSGGEVGITEVEAALSCGNGCVKA